MKGVASLSLIEMKYVPWSDIRLFVMDTECGKGSLGISWPSLHNRLARGGCSLKRSWRSAGTLSFESDFRSTAKSVDNALFSSGYTPISRADIIGKTLVVNRSKRKRKLKATPISHTWALVALPGWA